MHPPNYLNSNVASAPDKTVRAKGEQVPHGFNLVAPTIYAKISRIGWPPCAIGTGRPPLSGTVISGSMPRQR
jgi:hypothetical protein